MIRISSLTLGRKVKVSLVGNLLKSISYPCSTQMSNCLAPDWQKTKEAKHKCLSSWGTPNPGGTVLTNEKREIKTF
jgi:hypothetical protein